MQAELSLVIEALQAKRIHDESFHDFVDHVYYGSDLSNLTDDYTNVLFVTNLVHSRIVKLAEEVDLTVICYTNGHLPKAKDIERAKELEIDMISTALPLEDAKKALKRQFNGNLEHIT